MFLRSISSCCIRALLLLAVADIMVNGSSTGEETQNVGKLRASAEVALSKGEVDAALDIWDKVC